MAAFKVKAEDGRRDRDGHGYKILSVALRETLGYESTEMKHHRRHVGRFALVWNPLVKTSGDLMQLAMSKPIAC